MFQFSPRPSIGIIGEGTIFRLEEQKLVKNNQDNQVQNLGNFMQNIFFDKSIYGVQ